MSAFPVMVPMQPGDLKKTLQTSWESWEREKNVCWYRLPHPFHFQKTKVTSVFLANAEKCEKAVLMLYCI